jgi:hypothetical protein
VGRVTTGIGLACFLMLLASEPGRARTIVALYATATTLAGLGFVLVGRTGRGATPAAQGDAGASG